MYAIIATGGKQYKVSEGDIVKVELLKAEENEKIDLEVLMCADGEKVLVGKDVRNAKVSATVIGDGKGKKISIFRYKSKKNIRRRKGHRQPFTAIRIEKISM